MLFERPGSGKLGNRGDQRDLAAGDAQPPHQIRAGFRGISGLFGRGGDVTKEAVGTVFDKAGQEPPFGGGETAEERAVAEERSEQALPGRADAPGAREGGTGLIHRLRQRGFPRREAQRAQPRIGGPRRHGLGLGDVR